MQVQSLQRTNVTASQQFACDLSGEWGHLISQCPSDPNSFNYVASNNLNLNYPYMSNYSPGWSDNPNYEHSNAFDAIFCNKHIPLSSFSPPQECSNQEQKNHMQYK